MSFLFQRSRGSGVFTCESDVFLCLNVVCVRVCTCVCAANVLQPVKARDAPYPDTAALPPNKHGSSQNPSANADT